MSRPVAVLAMAYGTPAGPDDLAGYYTHIRHGRPPSQALLDELRERYDAIGGRSPLLEITRAQAAGIQDALRAAGHGDIKVAIGMKHAPPFIEDAVRGLVGTGVGHVIGLVLAPHFSRMSVQEYGERAAAAIGEAHTTFELIRSWATAPRYVRYLARAVTTALERLGPSAAAAEVVFTAHSLPAWVLDAGDPYADELMATAEAVARTAGIRRWSIAWQSAGRTADPWIGPDILDVLPRLAREQASGVVICPAGFVADHLEVLYDLDIEAAAAARDLGLPFVRTASPNASPELIATLVDVVASCLPRKVTMT